MSETTKTKHTAVGYVLSVLIEHLDRNGALDGEAFEAHLRSAQGLSDDYAGELKAIADAIAFERRFRGLEDKWRREDASRSPTSN